MKRKQIQNLMTCITQWQKAYARLEDKTQHKATYQEFYRVQQYCQKYLARLKNEESFDIEATRKEHHQWQDQFKKPDFIGEGQQTKVVQNTYTQLYDLANRMQAIDWTQTTITNNKLDLQYLKEVQDWKEKCKTWLEAKAPKELKQAEVTALATTFFTHLNKAAADVPVISE